MNKISLEIDGNRYQELVALRFENTIFGDSIHHVKLEKLIQQVSECMVDTTVFNASNFTSFPMEILLDYLTKGHQFYLQKKLPEIEQTIFQLTQILGFKNPFVLLINALYVEYKNELTKHIANEENYVFPYIRQLIKTSTVGIRSASLLNGWSTLASFLESHTDTGKDLQKIQQLILNYKDNSELKFILNRFATQLYLFENDLFIHHQIEEEVVLPKALEIELKRR